MIPTFITGNQHKAEYLSRYLGFSIPYQKLELEEIQSLNLEEIIIHKVQNAYNQIHKPVLVEDTALSFLGLNGLPGPFIKFFTEKLTLEEICQLIPKNNRDAVARCSFGFFDGKNLKTFTRELTGTISQNPQGSSGFGWDQIFIPTGFSETRSKMNDADYEKTYLAIKPIQEVREFILNLQSHH
jgi:non-canonical purine NTP pyrophosphatase (RdgB/HAM1 family)